MSRVALFGQISEINDHLYLSGSGVLRPDLKKGIEKLKQKGIDCIINVTVEEPMYYSDKIDCMKIRIEDSPYARLDQYFDVVDDKIRAVKDSGGKTLIHCVAGVSRSATLCIVYLMKYKHMNLRQAYHFVKSVRPIIRPNLGFWKQMIDYERKLRGSNSVSLVHVDNCPFPFPDVYSNELRRHIQSNPGPAHTDPSIMKQTHHQSHRTPASLPTSIGNGKATIIPVQIVGKRENFRPQMSSPAARSQSESGFVRALHSSALPWRAVAISPFLSPTMNRRSATAGPRYGRSSDSENGSLIGKLYGPGLFSAI